METTFDLPVGENPAIRLRIEHGAQQGRVFDLVGHRTFVVGRAQSAHFCLPEDDPYVSRHHFLIEANPPLCRLSDLNSRNGTKVNGSPATTVDLRSGDRIEAGMTVFRVEFPDLFGTARRSGFPKGEDLDAICEGQRSDWERGERKPAEAYIAELPSSLRTPESKLEVVACEAALRRQRGEKPTLQEYRDRFPSLADVLEFALEADLAASSIAPAATPSSAPPSLPGLRQMEEIGRGGMGIVFTAFRTSDGRKVAVKTIRSALAPNPTTTQRFVREADILKRLRHPNIVEFLDVGEASGVLYFVMEFVEGIDGSEWAKRNPKPSAGRVVRLAIQMADALQCAHELGFVHRDVKPGNILISDEDRLRLADFGLARTYQESTISGLTLSGTAAGSPAFMAPEQITDFRSVKPPCDQFSTAATIYYLLAGTPPFGAGISQAEIFRRVLGGAFVPLEQHRTDLPKGVCEALHRALHREPDRRFRDMRAFRTALENAIR
ncbi:MAG: protein kinase [Gemmataceae bacterium]|nr:protein kinase [Gemmataceae bacterium]